MSDDVVGSNRRKTQSVVHTYMKTATSTALRSRNDMHNLLQYTTHLGQGYSVLVIITISDAEHYSVTPSVHIIISAVVTGVLVMSATKADVCFFAIGLTRKQSRENISVTVRD